MSLCHIRVQTHSLWFMRYTLHITKVHMAIFHDMVEDFMDIFIDDFSVFGKSFDVCLKNLDKVLARYEETKLILNWKKCYFLVKEG